MRLGLGLGLGLSLILAGAAQAQPVKTDHVTAELLARVGGVAPGQTVDVGLRLQHLPNWHTYWRNPGDSGLPTILRWTLPPGVQASGFDWPAPKRLPVGPLVNYGYDGDVLLPLRLSVPADAQPGSTLSLSALAQWLVCHEVCIPESAELQLKLPVLVAGQTAAPSAAAPQFDKALALRAQPMQGWQAEMLRAGNDLQLRLTPSTGAVGAAGASDPTHTSQASRAALPSVHFFPYSEQLTEAARHSVYRVGQGYVLQLGLGPGARPGATVEGVLVAQGSPSPFGDGVVSVALNAALREVPALSLPADAVALVEPLAQASPSWGGLKIALGGPGGGGTTPGTASGVVGGGASGGLLAALGLAFLGGMLLNLMPCVFPVLSIKLLGLPKKDAARGVLRTHALAYSAGVVLSFLALAALLLTFRSAGEAVGWGFQLQSPAVVFSLALLFAALGLNLLGTFEVGQWMPQRLAGWQSHHPVVGAAGSGVLAVLAASPCTAPFMGAALGFALTQPTPWALGVFAALGLGMATPYALLTLLPGWRRRLPRSGAWMLHVKQFLAFPMFATVVWLLWVLGLQTDTTGLAWALMGVLGLALAAWTLGVLRASGRGHGLASASAALALVAWLWWVWPAEHATAKRVVAGTQTGALLGSAEQAPDPWMPYSDAAMQTHLAQGKTVFVDFTAAWCVSCLVNKKLVLGQPEVLAHFKRAGVVMMRADWTRPNAEISAALSRLGRSGVPVYLLQRPGQPPQLLPEVLTAGLVHEALDKL